MESWTALLVHAVFFLSFVKSCSACYGYCWYGSWYIWFAVIMTLAICCGALGSYLRRRRIQQALRARQAEVVTVQVSSGPVGMIPAPEQPYVYPGNANPFPNTTPAAAHMMTPPPYNTAVNTSSCPAQPLSATAPDKAKDEDALPPSYVEAVSQSAYGIPVQSGTPHYQPQQVPSPSDDQRS